MFIRFLVDKHFLYLDNCVAAKSSEYNFQNHVHLLLNQQTNFMKPAFAFIVFSLVSISSFSQKDSAAYLLAKKLYDASKPDSASLLLQQVLASKESSYFLKSESHSLLGHIELDKGNLPATLQHYIQAEKFGLDNHDLDLTTQAAINISGVYREQNNLVTARNYIDKAAINILQLKNTKILGNFYNNKAILLEMTKQFDSAADMYNKAIDIYMAAKDSNRIAIGYNNLGVLYKNKGDYDKALVNYQEVVEIEKLIGNKFILGSSYINIGSVYIQQKRFGEAIRYNKMGLEIASEISAQYLVVIASENMAEAYYGLKMPDSAYAWQKLRAVENEKYLNAENSRQINEMQTKFDTEKKEQTIALQQSQLSKQHLLLISGAVIFLLLLLYGYLFYRRYKLKKENELKEQLILQREEATVNILTAEENERKRIAAELHDGIGQLMMAAWMNLQAIGKQEAKEIDQQQLLQKTTLLVGESCKEIRQVSHSMMPNALLKKGLVNAVKEFTQQIDKSVISINVQAEGLDAAIDSLTETILYRVIQECVNNTIKHAQATELDISIYNTEEGIDMLVEDNGKGFDASLLNNRDSGLGLQNIRSRISFLKGSVHWDSVPGNGTVVSIHIPPRRQ